jgi:hypothetical protein
MSFVVCHYLRTPTVSIGDPRDALDSAGIVSVYALVLGVLRARALPKIRASIIQCVVVFVVHMKSLLGANNHAVHVYGTLLAAFSSELSFGSI